MQIDEEIDDDLKVGDELVPDEIIKDINGVIMFSDSDEPGTEPMLS